MSWYDGSTDGTREVHQTIAGIRVILLPATRGRGTARRSEAGPIGCCGCRPSGPSGSWPRT